MGTGAHGTHHGDMGGVGDGRGDVDGLGDGRGGEWVICCSCAACEWASGAHGDACHDALLPQNDALDIQGDHVSGVHGGEAQNDVHACGQLLHVHVNGDQADGDGDGGGDERHVHVDFLEGDHGGGHAHVHHIHGEGCEEGPHDGDEGPGHDAEGHAHVHGEGREGGLLGGNEALQMRKGGPGHHEEGHVHAHVEGCGVGPGGDGRHGAHDGGGGDEVGLLGRS